MKKIRNTKNQKISKGYIDNSNGDEYDIDTFVRTEKNKCLIRFPISRYAKKAMSEDLGLIALLMTKGLIPKRELGGRKISAFWGERDEHFHTFKFDKKDTAKIKAIEKEYLANKIEHNVRAISSLIMEIVNYWCN